MYYNNLTRKGGIIIYYNLAAEYSAFWITGLAMISIFAERSVIFKRYKGLKWMYLFTFLSIFITIGSITTAEYFTEYPIWIVRVLKALYFLMSPILAPLYVFYSISIINNDYTFKQLVKQNIWTALPYAIYIVFICLNPLHKLIFEISPTEGYIRGLLYHITYYIAFIYFALLICYAIKNRKTPQKKVLAIICINFFLSTCIFTMQIFIPPLQLSGIACTSGLLIVHFYIISVSKSMDQLTELKNRHTLTLHLDDLCHSNKTFYLAVFSIRNFKGINERFGLEIGDNLLREMAFRLRMLLPSKYLYRYSGDEFALINTNIETEEFNHQLKYVLTNISKPFEVMQNPISLDIAYARVDFPEFGTTTKELIPAMDYSLYEVKKINSETNFYYDITICDKMKRRNYIIEKIKHAIENDGFEAHYQAIYSSEHKAFTMAEALIRFKESDDAFVSPGEFIPIAEEIGLVSKITFIVLHKVCKDFSELVAKYGNKFTLKSISINFPYVNFIQKYTVAEVIEILKIYGLSHDKIKIELTERTLISDTNTTRNVMQEFIENGFVLELDDFGVEYSNLSLLFNIPVQIIKFDRSLVMAAVTDKTNKKFFEQLVTAIKTAGYQVIMEGVETEELLKYLINYCESDYIQGYVFSKPLPLNQFDEFLQSNDNLKLIDDKK